jgi:hypothetical protein
MPAKKFDRKKSASGRWSAGDLLPAFIAALGRHGIFERQLDPPEV